MQEELMRGLSAPPVTDRTNNDDEPSVNAVGSVATRFLFQSGIELVVRRPYRTRTSSTGNVRPRTLDGSSRT